MQEKVKLASLKAFKLKVRRQRHSQYHLRAAITLVQSLLNGNKICVVMELPLPMHSILLPA